MGKKLVHIVIFLAAVSALYFLSEKFFFRWDLTSEKRYSLSDNTKLLLSDLDEDLLVTIYLDGDLNSGFLRLRKSTKELFEEAGESAASLCKVGKGVGLLFAVSSEGVLCSLSEAAVVASIGIATVSTLCGTALLLHLFGLSPMFAIFIVASSLFRVGQHLVCLVQLLELSLCSRVVGGEIGVILASQSTVGPLDVCLGSGALQAGGGAGLWLYVPSGRSF